MQPKERPATRRFDGRRSARKVNATSPACGQRTTIKRAKDALTLGWATGSVCVHIPIVPSDAVRRLTEHEPTSTRAGLAPSSAPAYRPMHSAAHRRRPRPRPASRPDPTALALRHRPRRHRLCVHPPTAPRRGVVPHGDVARWPHPFRPSGYDWAHRSPARRTDTGRAVARGRYRLVRKPGGRTTAEWDSIDYCTRVKTHEPQHPTASGHSITIGHRCRTKFAFFDPHNRHFRQA